MSTLRGRYCRLPGGGALMGAKIEQLLSIAGPSIGPPEADPTLGGTTVHNELAELLSARNGFVAFESALHVFPTGRAVQGEMTLEQWNAIDLWRKHYDHLDGGALFFAEDVFGGQFAIRNDAVELFDPETGEFTTLSTTIEGWAAALLDDPAVLTGYPLAHQWQMEHGRLTTQQRLVPKQPFVLGGEFSLQNLYVVDAAVGMRLRGDIARQLKDLPDGATVRFEVGP